MRNRRVLSLALLALSLSACGGGSADVPRTNETPPGYIRRHISIPAVTIPLVEVEDDSTASGVGYVAPDRDNHVIFNVDLTNRPKPPSPPPTGAEGGR